MIKVTIKTDLPLGTWQGMGGAITEATAYNFAKLSPAKQRELLKAYYGKDGLDYRWGRISIGSNDFCLKPYEYTKSPDLHDFSIRHDQKWVLPMLKQILAQKDLKLLASPWSPPRFMKLVYGQRLDGFLKPWYYQRYARYLRRWLDDYAKAGVKINYLVPQNEPRAFQKWESCFYSYRGQRKLAYKYLAQALSDLDTQILLWDHNKKRLAKTANKLFSGKYATRYGRDQKIAGLCYHWYNGTHEEQMWQVRQKYPDIMMVSSEMCCGWSPYNAKTWQNDARQYLREIFSDINTGTSAWIDWNMLLDWRGGPNHVKNYTKSPVILNETGDDFILTPIYTVLKKFAKLFPVGSKVVRCEYDSESIVAVARKTKSGYKVVVANISEQEQIVTIKLGSQKKSLQLAVAEIWWGKFEG